MKARFFGYNDQYGRYEELNEKDLPGVSKNYREVEIFYDALAVEKTLTHYESFFEQVGANIEFMPDFMQKFYFDMKRRIDFDKAYGKIKTLQSPKTQT